MATSWRAFPGTFLSGMSARHWGRRGRWIIGAVLLVAWAVWPWEARSENRLANEKSPYLLLHKENPVEWYPWGAEAFARAKRENKPVFVSIGYSACHWCHVMARESFENHQTAQLLNDYFINVKVDREERPDVDRLCMAFVQATTGSGGWPMNVWMTPEGEPFFGGTYFPPEDLPGRPSFRKVIRQIAEGWVSDEAGIRAHGGKFMAALRSSSVSKPPEAATGMVRSGYEELVRVYDPQWGGFGTQEKFPQASALNFLVRLHASEPASPEGQAALEMVRNSLSKMAAGGIRDHLGGGFHRYAVDRTWHLPHFEKMLSDQAQLAAVYGAAWQITGDPLFEEMARETLDHVLRDLTHPEGGFFTAIDAESLVTPGGSSRREGAYYVWSAGEIGEVLNPDERRLFELHYGVKPEGNVPAAADPRGELQGKNVLSAQQSIAETARKLNLRVETVDQMLDGIKAKLRVVRDRRPSPRRDEKILTAWNGLMISACARVGAAFHDERYVAAAAKAARFLRGQFYDAKSGTLRRSWNREAATIPGFAEDYAFLIQGLLDLYEVSADSEALEWAIALQRKQDEFFWDSKAGGYFCSAADPLIKVRLKQDHDGAEPSANSVSALNLLRLSRMLHDDQYAQRAKGIFHAFSPTLSDAPASVPQLVSAWQFAQAQTRQAVIAGDPQSESGRRLARSVFRDFHPDLVVLYSRDARILSGDAASAVAAMRPVAGLSALYVCENFVCREPVTSPEKAHRLLARTQEIDQKEEDVNGR